MMASGTILARCQCARYVGAATQIKRRSQTFLGSSKCFTSFARCPVKQSRGVSSIVNGEDIRGAKMERSLFGEDFGARDPFPGEVETNFTDKVLGNYNTEHIIKPPDAMGEIIGLKSKKCIPCEGKDLQPLDDKEVERLRLQVPGWRVTTDREGRKCIRQEWKVRNFTAGLELFGRIAKIAEEEGHHPDLHLEGYNNVYAELSTHSVGGLTENDFILASKINEVPVADLQPKKKPKFWA